MTLEQLEELKERLTKATGPDSGLDEAIMLVLQPHHADGGYSLLEVPRYTASLDAAIALTNAVLPGYARINDGSRIGAPWAGYTDKFLCRLYPPHEKTTRTAGVHYDGEHQSEPIAILLATVNALIEREKNDDKAS